MTEIEPLIINGNLGKVRITYEEKMWCIDLWPHARSHYLRLEKSYFYFTTAKLVAMALISPVGD